MDRSIWKAEIEGETDKEILYQLAHIANVLHNQGLARLKPGVKNSVQDHWPLLSQ